MRVERNGGRVVKITVEVDELESGHTDSHAVADYVRAMLRVRALRRALGEALLDAERRKQKLNTTRLEEAQRLLEAVGAARERVRLLRRPRRGSGTEAGEGGEQS